MSQRSAALDAIDAMEDDVYSVLRYAQALMHISSSPHMIEADCLTALCDPLIEIGKRLRKQFKEAHTAAGGQQ